MPSSTPSSRRSAAGAAGERAADPARAQRRGQAADPGQAAGGGQAPDHGRGAARARTAAPSGLPLPKTPTGVSGFDEITHGGLPRGRPTLVCGGAGCGKTLFGLQFLVRGALDHGEPGLLMSFEERPEDIVQNVASLGYDLDDLMRQKLLAIDHVRVERSEIEETGEYDLEGLFIRMGFALDAIGAKRVVLDTIEALFSGFDNATILRAELRRLFTWLKDRGVTAVITGERGDGTLTRHGLEEYVSDCVILLDHRVQNQVSTRRLRVMKYRGSTHGTNEYPFLIDQEGIHVLPVTSLGLAHGASDERMSTGIAGLDAMLDGGGLYRGSSVLLSGTAGTGKTSVAAHFADAVCRGGESCLYLSFEESPAQIVRNMRSIRLELEPHVREGRLVFWNERPSTHGLEMHLALVHRLIDTHRPALVIIDPVTALLQAGTPEDARVMLLRLVDHFKIAGITSLFTSLTHGGHDLEQSEIGMSSLMDTWILLRDIEHGGERNRGLYVLKSRGMGHSNQIREFLLTGEGVQLLPPYLGPEGVLTGSARVAQHARQRLAEQEREQALAREHARLQSRRAQLEAQMRAVQAELEAEAEALRQLQAREQARQQAAAEERVSLARSRRAGDAAGQAAGDAPGDASGDGARDGSAGGGRAAQSASIVPPAPRRQGRKQG